jgi:crossover junction endodeoxyribonuclease RuvC
MRLIGLDPGLRHTGWGVIDASGNRLIHVADGVVHSRASRPLAERLVDLFRQLNDILARYRPDEAAVEESFVNKNPASTLKLGVARGVVLLAPAERGIPVFEYSANLVKKSVVGVGHADKRQIEVMVKRLLPAATLDAADAADALAVAICHAHHAATGRFWNARQTPLSPAGRGRGPHEAREGEGEVVPDTITHEHVPSPAPSPRPSLLRGEGDLRVDAQRKPSPAETARARRLRQESTDVEKLLWRKLRDRQLDEAKFRRQEPILGFTADFVCHERRLVVELDGGQHPWRADQDAQRTRLLEQAGFRVLRFGNLDVIENIDGVLESIRLSLAQPAGAAR